MRFADSSADALTARSVLASGGLGRTCGWQPPPPSSHSNAGATRAGHHEPKCRSALSATGRGDGAQMMQNSACSFSVMPPSLSLCPEMCLPLRVSLPSKADGEALCQRVCLAHNWRKDARGHPGLNHLRGTGTENLLAARCIGLPRYRRTDLKCSSIAACVHPCKVQCMRVATRKYPCSFISPLGLLRAPESCIRCVPATGFSIITQDVAGLDPDCRCLLSTRCSLQRLICDVSCVSDASRACCSWQ